MIFPIIFTLVLCICLSVIGFIYFSFLKKDFNNGIGDKEFCFIKEHKVNNKNQKIAVIKCSPNRENQKHKMQHYKMIDCRIYLDTYGHNGFCSYGCLGYGTCLSMCPESAIILKNDTAIVTEKCTGCGICVKSCPQNLIELIDYNSDTFKQCSLPDGVSNDNCSSGCISCKKCDSKDFKLEYCPHMCIKKSSLITNKGFKFWEFCYNIFHRDNK